MQFDELVFYEPQIQELLVGMPEEIRKNFFKKNTCRRDRNKKRRKSRVCLYPYWR